MKELTDEYQNDKLEFIKNPVVAEFLGLASKADFTENDLEKSILTNQDVGQMDMYIRMYDELKRSEGDNPTIGYEEENIEEYISLPAAIFGKGDFFILRLP